MTPTLAQPLTTPEVPPPVAEWVALLAHDLRSPLNVVMMTAELLSEDRTMTERYAGTNFPRSSIRPTRRHDPG